MNERKVPPLMSSYHLRVSSNNEAGLSFELPEEVVVSLEGMLDAMCEGLLAFCVSTGLGVLHEILEAEVDALVGPKGKHNPDRQAFRHGSTTGSLVLGGRKIRVRRPRVRSTDDDQEMPLESYRVFQNEDLLLQATMEQILLGLAGRRYKGGLEPVGEDVQEKSNCTSRSAVSRRFIQGTEKALSQLMSRPLDEERYPVLLIDGIEFAEHMIVAAMGIDSGGSKQVLGIWHGSTENKALCRSLLADLVDRGLSFEDGILVVIDGSRGLRSAVREVFGDLALVQRCQVHKKRNVVDQLPKERQEWVKRQMNRAYEELDHHKAQKDLEHLADTLENQHPGAAASLREGLEETLTVTRLGLPALLKDTVSSTNSIESAFAMVRDATRNVKRWRNGKQVMRWSAAALMDAEQRFNRIKGYRDIPMLTMKLRQHLQAVNGEITNTGGM
jgi:putative transposase